MTLATTQDVLNLGTLGEFAEDHDTAILADGRIAVVYDQTNLNGRVRVFDHTDGSFVEADIVSQGDDLRVAPLDDGGFAVVYTARSDDLRLQIFNADATTRGAESVVIDGELRRYALSETSDGGLYLTYVYNVSGTPRTLRGQMLDSTGAKVGAEQTFLPDHDSGQAADGAVLEDGTLALAWFGKPLIGSFIRSFFTQRLDANGAPIGTPQVIDDTTNGQGGRQGAKVAATPGGGYSVLFYDQAPDSFQYGLYLARYGADGASLGAPVFLEMRADPANDADVPIALDHASSYDIQILDSGQIVVAFQTVDMTGPDDGKDIFHAAFNPDGSNVLPLTRVNEHIEDDQFHVDLEKIDGDTLYLSYGDDTNVLFGQQQGIMGVEITRSERPADPPRELNGGDDPDDFSGGNGHDTLRGGAGNDTLDGGDGSDTINGGDGDDFIFGGATAADLLDLIFGGDGDDSIDAGYGNDSIFGGTGGDTIAGGFGVDTVEGQDGDDVITGSAFSDLIFGGLGTDFINGGFGHDRVNGGAGGDGFYHLGILGHGSDWIQDFLGNDGDKLIYGAIDAALNDFQVNVAVTDGAGDAAVAEAFVIYKPTGQILWALVDGAGQDSIELQIGGQTFDLMV